MRISDLSRESGTPLPTIKFYLRAGLLPAGQPTARNQAIYHKGHLARLRMIRALSAIGHLDLATIHDLITAAEDESMSASDLGQVVNGSLWKDPASPETADTGNEFVRRFLDDLGWTVSPGSSALRMLAQVVTMMHELGCDSDASFFRPYAIEAARAAAVETSMRSPGGVISDRMASVVRSVLLEAAVLALRRMAHESRLLDIAPIGPRGELARQN